MLASPAVVPVVDLADPSAARVLRDAAQTLGMFVVENHGVPPALIAAHFELARSFFALDLAEKRAIEVREGGCFRGYEPIGTQTIDDAAPGDLKEGFIMGPDLPPGHPHVLAGYPNTGANRWPSRPAHFQAHMERYVDAMNGLGRRVARVLACALDLPANYFAAALREPSTYSQLFHYPSVAPERESASLGAGEHVDWGLLTILLQDDVGGLEVRTPDGRRHAVAPVPDAFVVILGELILRLTDGQFRSAPHRVARNTTGRSRYAMPTFIDPDYDAWIACVPTCQPADREPRYPACTLGAHMLEMARTTLSAGPRP